MTNNFTPTQAAMLKVLADGLPHHKEELHACLPDELGADHNIAAHLSNIRKTLRPQGQDVICVWERRKRMYRWVRLINVRD